MVHAHVSIEPWTAQRVRECYREMRKAGWPADRTMAGYVRWWAEQEDRMVWELGAPNGGQLRAMVYLIEAAHACCWGKLPGCDGPAIAKRLTQLAMEELASK